MSSNGSYLQGQMPTQRHCEITYLPSRIYWHLGRAVVDRPFLFALLALCLLANNLHFSVLKPFVVQSLESK